MAFAVDNRKIAKNTVALYIRTAITMVIGFFTARITLQLLGSDDYGLNNLVGGVVSLFSFLNASMGTAVQRFFNIEMGRGNKEKLGKVYGVGLYLHIIVASITFILCEIFAVFFLSKMNIPPERMFAAHVVFQISICSMVLNIINVPNYALLKAHEEFSKLAIIEIIQAVLRLGVLLLLYTINFDKLIIYSSLNLGVSLYYVSSIFFSASKYPESHSKICRDKDLIKKMLGFISMLVVTVLAELGRKQGLVMIVNIFFGLAVNAAFAIASQVSHFVSTFVVNIKQPMVPQMMSAYGAGDKRSMHRLIFMGTKITAILLLLISLPVMFEMTQLLTIWLKEPPQFADKLAILVLINSNISSFTYFLYQGVHATGNITKQQIIMSSLYVLTLLLILIAFKLGANFYSALYITMAISTTICIMNMVMAHHYYNLNIGSFLRKCFFPCLFVAGITITALWGITSLMEPSWVRLAIVLVGGAGLVAALGYFLVLEKDERQKMLSLVHLDRFVNKKKKTL